MKKVRIGYAPTRRNLFDAEDALIYANKIRDVLNACDIEFVDIFDINEEGLLYNDEGVEAVYEKFNREGVDGLFVPHCNFGTEYAVAKLAKKLNVPVLLWGPRDEAPEVDGSRLRDSQCGLFATGKVLRRFQVKFTYLTNCWIEDDYFKQGLKDFERVCHVVKTFKGTRILQIGPRPYDFWSVIWNEGELLERYNIQLSPIPLGELYKKMEEIEIDQKELVADTISKLHQVFTVEITPEEVKKVAVLKLALRQLGDFYGCNAAALQCWNDFQQELNMTPYGASAILQDEEFPVVCETDIHGAITVLLADAAAYGDAKSMFADYTVRHPENENGELLQHLGVFPPSTAKDGSTLIKTHFVFDYPGSVGLEAKQGDMTLVRFDGDNGEYNLLLGNAKGIDGPYNQGSFVWIEVENLKRLEHKLVTGPYIHHCAAIHGDLVPILYEACKYIDVKADFFDPIEEKVQAYWRGEVL